MLKNLFALVFGAAFLLAVGTAMADWKPGDGHKMHWPQLPDEQGWDVNATYLMTLADDWECSESGPVLDIHFWGSWRDFDEDGLGDEGNIEAFIIRIWTNIPEDQPNIPYSRPGTMEWEMYAEEWAVVPIDPPTLEHWFDPSIGLVVNNDHGNYWQYNIDIEAMGIDPFHQVAGTTYWLQISAVVTLQAEPHEWGWKSSIDHWMDDAVWSPEGALDWTEIVEPARYNEFSATFDADGTWGSGGGTNYYSDGTDDHGWYYYDPVDPGDPTDNPWYNIWFYDNPFNTDNDKIAYIHGSVEPITAGKLSQVIVAVNWSTDLWSLEGTSGQPPLPGVNQSQMIGRQVIWQFDGYLEADETFSEMWEWLAYNPEWISIDVWGYNFGLSGAITHECVTTSLDLAFVITGGETTLGACCLQDGTCVQDTQANCETAAVNGIYVGGPCDTDGDLIDDACDGVLPTGACCWSDDSCTDPLTAYDCVSNGGTYMGDGSVCLGDSDSDGNDDLCVPPQSTGACCWPDGTCTDPISQYDCENPVGAAPGTYKGDGSVCLGDSDGDGNDDLCVPPQNTGACCWPDGTCTDPISQYDCENPVGATPGTYMGDGSFCLGDGDSNGIDDACEDPGGCCMPDGSCIPSVSYSWCMNNGGWYWMGGDRCFGDQNGNGIDDDCEGGALKWVQAPDLEVGDDVNCTYHPDGQYPYPYLLANDWRCIQTGLITEIHVWGSWHLDYLPYGDPLNVQFNLSIHEDIPANPPNTPYSMPGELKCFMHGPPFEVRQYQDGLQEGWMEVDPGSGVVHWWPYGSVDPPTGDEVCWEYIFHVEDWDCMQNGTPDEPKIYWLDVQAYPNDPDAWFGWKTSMPHRIDDAVWAFGVDDGVSAIQWGELRFPGNHYYYPNQSVDLAFAIFGEEEPVPTGACCYDDGSCVDGMTAADCAASGGSYGGDGSQCAGVDGDGNGVDDFCDDIVTLGACCWGNPISPTCTNTTQYLCELAGGGYAGTWYAGQDCATFECPVSGACCYLDPASGWTCVITATAADCNALPNSAWYEGTDCASVECPSTGACCYGVNPHSPSCANSSEADCTNMYNGTWYGGEDCATFVCPVPMGACCYGDPANPTCGDMGLLACDNLAGTWYEGEVCANFTCPTTQPEKKWEQLPDLNCGADVNCTYNVGSGINPYLLANDFECTSTGQITKIHVYGSWYHDYLPYGSPDRVQFILSIHEDIPAGPVGFSKPGDIVCLIEQPPYQIVQYATDVVEGWLEPSPTGQTTWEPNADHVCWEYIFDVSGYDCFQFGTDGAPVVYWLDVQAYPDDQEAWFGWKTVMATQNWNDDACYAFDVDGASHAIDWRELIWPSNQPCWGGQSVDLAFAIYGIEGQPPGGACCYEDGTCVDGMIEPDCIASGGDYGGDGTNCANADSDQNGVDDFCDDIVTLGACCYGDPHQPSCVNTTQTICESAVYNGTWYAGEDCANFVCPVPTGACCYGDQADLSCGDMGLYACNNLNGTWYEDEVCADIICPTDPIAACCYGDPSDQACVNTTQALCQSQYHGVWYPGQDCGTFECPTGPMGACCIDDGTVCQTLSLEDCRNAGGTYVGDGTVCLGDSDQNGLDDACEGKILKWEQPPDLMPSGMDVYGMDELVLASDFLCQTTGPIKEIHVWSSWQHDEFPGNPREVSFTLSFHKDIPAAQSPTGYSVPGELLCRLYDFMSGEFEVRQWPTMEGEGWYDPSRQYYEYPGDFVCWEYIFRLPDDYEQLCYQEGTDQEAIVYWLDVRAHSVVGPAPFFWGWKTTRIELQWNDNSVWSPSPAPVVDPGQWMELYYPPDHIMHPQLPLDLAFSIYNEAPCCIGRVGNTNGLGTDEPTIGDVSVMIDALFISGDINVIVCLAEADINQSGGPSVYPSDITIGDISTLIDYLFITGKPLGLLDCL